MATQTHSNRSPRRLWALAGLAIAGFGVSVYQTSHFYEVHSGGAGFKSICNVSAKMNCDLVAASPWAELLSGFPLSSFAAGWYLALFVVALLAGNLLWRREAIRAAFVISSWAVICSVIWFVVMATQLKTWCLFCLIVDAINVALLIVSLSLKPACPREHSPDFAQWKKLLGVMAGVTLVTVLGLKILDSAKPSEGEMRELIGGVMNTPPVAVGSGPEYPSFGPADAPITIVEFSDFQCPYCRIGAMVMNSVMNLNPGKVRIVFRNFPLDPSCNRKVEHQMHQVACEAARVGNCAHRAGKFKEVYEGIFEHQTALKPGSATELARDAGMIDEAALKACASSDEARNAVTKDVEEGIQLNIASTPTFFINGRKVEGVFPIPVWNELIKQLSAGK